MSALSGDPFPLEEADEHFTRLRQWGLTFLRFLVSWEAVEHEAPGVYDTAYLDYMQAVVEKAGEYGFHALHRPPSRCLESL
jgi:aryl-phospho-beta-D-glucosidase BglC (GH1 family)